MRTLSPRLARRALGATALLSALALGVGCNTTDICTGDQCTSNDPDGGNPPDVVAQLTGLVIDPQDVTLVSQDGSKPTQTFTVRGKLADGTLSSPLRAEWSLSASTLGGIDAGAGSFTATGEVGGAVRVRVVVARASGNLGADTGLTVKVQRQILGTGTPMNAPSLFADPLATDATREPGVVYPLNNAVMPQNVYPANVQWTRGAAGDTFRVRLRKPNVEINAFVQAVDANFTNSWEIDATAWRALAQSDGDVAGTITVDRYEAASKKAYGGTAVSLRLIKAALLGSIYYWDIAAGRIYRIDDGTAKRVAFMPTPPAGPVDNNSCIGCHGVSRDGRYMVGRLGGGSNPATVFDLTRDLTGAPAPSLWPVTAASPRTGFSSFSPDSSRLITSTFDSPPGTMVLLNAMTGAVVAPKGGALPTGTYPSWSPDGRSIAFVSEANNWGGELTAGNLSVLPVTGADTFGAVKQIVKADAQNPATGYPTWSPDSRWLAMFRGALSRSDSGAGALWLSAADGTQLTRLDKANGAANNNFLPNFSPFDSGGYFWVMFLSKRDYGNSRAGTAGTSRQQLWVTAISNKPQAGQDPSEIPYWLPGQATTSQNISGYWAPKACRKDTEQCSVGSECCGGLCVAGKCQPPPVDQCRAEGMTCGGGGCCPGLTCDRNNICTAILG